MGHFCAECLRDGYVLFNVMDNVTSALYDKVGGEIAQFEPWLPGISLPYLLHALLPYSQLCKPTNSLLNVNLSDKHPPSFHVI